MFARFQHRRRKFGMIYRVGEVLRLKADGVAFAVNSAVFADSLGEKTGGVKLHPLKRGSHLELYSAGFGNQNRCGGLAFIQHKIVVKAAGGGKLGMGKAVAKQSSVSEIKGGTIDRSDLAGGNIAAIGRGEAVGVTVSRWSVISPWSCPDRLKYAWLVRFTTVSLVETA